VSEYERVRLLCAGSDNSGELLAETHETYLRWFGKDYDLDALDCVLAAAAAEKLGGDPPWLLVVSGSGAAKTETVMPLAAAGAVMVSTINGEAALLSGTSAKERTKNATGGLLRSIGERGVLVVKDVTSILSMNRDTRALVLAALREIYDGRWSRNVGTDGGKTLTWRGRLVVIGAVTTAWDSAYQVIATMGDRFVLVRIDSTENRRAAGKQALRNVNREAEMREELSDVIKRLLGSIPDGAGVRLTDAEMERLLDLADVVTRARTAVERDYAGGPVFAHAPEMPTRFAKQLAQIVRGGLSLGMARGAAMAVAVRCAGDTMPPLRLKVVGDVAGHPMSRTAEVVKRLQLPRQTVDRVLQELHLLGLLVVDEEPYGERVRWIYALAPEVDRDAVTALITRKCSPELSLGEESEPPSGECDCTCGSIGGLGTLGCTCDERTPA